MNNKFRRTNQELRPFLFYGARMKKNSYRSFINFVTLCATILLTSGSTYSQILSENFEGTSFPPTGWTTASLGGTVINMYWSRYAVSANGIGEASANYNYFDSQTGNIHALISPTFSYTSDGTILDFDYAYASRFDRIDELRIDYSTNAGSSWNVLILLQGGSNGSLVTAPSQLIFFSPNATQWRSMRLSLTEGINRIRFVAQSWNGNALYLDNIIVRQIPTIDLSGPNGGEFWQWGTQHNIQWTSSNIANVKIEYSTNNGSIWSTIVSSIPAQTGQYAWEIPNVSSANCKVRISDVIQPNTNDVSDSTFEISNSIILLTRPNGGETWQSGTPQNIQWSYSYIENIKIEYSTDNGISWSTIVSSTPAISGQYTWTVPAINSTQCKIRVSDVSNVNVYDISDNVFSITRSVITLTRPNGGETWFWGTSEGIQWMYEFIDSVKIEYSTNGVNWTTIVSSTPAITGHYTWIVPNLNSYSCKVKISDISNPQVFDISNLAFRILPGIINVTKPNGGEIWQWHASENIQWTFGNVDTVIIKYSTDNGSTWTVITPGTPAMTGQYAWTVPKTQSTQCKVMIVDKINPGVYDISNSTFTIKPNATIALLRPNGGETWLWGSLENIEWSYTNIDSIKIEFSSDNGSSWSTIISGLTSSSGQYVWTVPVIKSTACRIKISDASFPGLSDMSDNVFSIKTNASLILTSPNGNEIWEPGTTQTITWVSSNIDSIKIEYFTSSSGTWKTIFPSFLASDGQCFWTLPNIEGNCRVRITNLKDASVFDISDNFFHILFAPVRFNDFSFYSNVTPSISNPNNYLSFGKSIRFKVQILNTLGVNLLAAYGKIDSKTPGISITDSLASFNNVLQGESGWSIDEFEISAVKSGENRKLDFNLSIYNALDPQGPWISAFSIIISPIRIHYVFLDDDNNPDSQGNNNKIVELNEIIEVIPLLQNKSTETIYQVKGKLFTALAGINVWNNYQGVSDTVYDNWRFNYLSSSHYPIIPGATQITPEQDYVFSRGNLPHPTLTFIMEFEGKLGGNSGPIIKWDDEFILQNGNISVYEQNERDLPPENFNLSQNYPNPFNPSTIISYEIPIMSTVSLRVYDLIGNEVAILVDEQQVPGYYSINFNATSLSTGVYFYQLKSGDFVSTKKLILMK